MRKQLAEKGIRLEVTNAALSAIAEEGYDPTYGARPLKRVIQQRMQNPLAVEMLKQEFGEGSRREDRLRGRGVYVRAERMRRRNVYCPAKSCYNKSGAVGHVGSFMVRTIDATFDGIVFRPAEPISLKPNTRVRLTVETPEPATDRPRPFSTPLPL